jgi:putative ABC transport system substrate-binding protein
MKRRGVLVICGGSLIALSLKARAQKSPAVIGFLGGQVPQGRNPRSEALLEGFRKNGLLPGRDFIFEARFSEGDDDRYPELARELATRKARMILANTPGAVRAAQQLDPPIPVIMTYINDPVDAGLISSLAHPGNHTTGTASLNEDVTAKVLEFAKQILPNATKVAVVHNPNNLTHDRLLQSLASSLPSIGLASIPFALRPRDDLDRLFSALTAAQVDAVLLLGDPSIIETLRDRLSILAIAGKLPVFSTSMIATEAGALLSYGGAIDKILLRTGYYAKRILDGANAGELPVEQPTEVILVINLKTAKDIGVEISPTLLARADRVIE